MAVSMFSFSEVASAASIASIRKVCTAGGIDGAAGQTHSVLSRGGAHSCSMQRLRQKRSRTAAPALFPSPTVGVLAQMVLHEAPHLPLVLHLRCGAGRQDKPTGGTVGQVAGRGSRRRSGAGGRRGQPGVIGRQVGMIGSLAGVDAHAWPQRPSSPHSCPFHCPEELFPSWPCTHHCLDRVPEGKQHHLHGGDGVLLHLLPAVPPSSTAQQYHQH